MRVVENENKKESYKGKESQIVKKKSKQENLYEKKIL